MAMSSKNRLTYREGKLQLSSLEEPIFAICYRAPLTKELITWHTSDLNQFVRKYASLVMSSVAIVDTVIKWKGIKNND